MEIMDHPLFSVALADEHARSLSCEDGFACAISIDNFLPMVCDGIMGPESLCLIASFGKQEITLSSLRISFSAGEFQQFDLKADSTVLRPGANIVQVTSRVEYCMSLDDYTSTHSAPAHQMPFAGVLRIESATLFKDRLAFEYSLGNQGDRNAVLQVPRDPLAVQVTARVARNSKSA